jgi:protein disulfide-isomerase
MKWVLIIILIASVAVLGCTPNPKPNTETTPEATENVSFDDAMATYKGGEWLTSYDDALKAAQETKRPILMNFSGSDWCSWCIKLSNEVFTQDAFSKYAKDNLVLLNLDFPKRTAQSAEMKAANEKLAQTYKIEGFPTVVLLDSNGKEIDRLGYQPGGATPYVKRLQELLTSSK